MIIGYNLGPVLREGQLRHVAILRHPSLARDRMVLSGRPKRCKLAHALPCEYSSKGLKLAPLLGQPSACPTCARAEAFAVRVVRSAPPAWASGGTKQLSATWGPAAVPLQEQGHRIC